MCSQAIRHLFQILMRNVSQAENLHDPLACRQQVAVNRECVGYFIHEACLTLFRVDVDEKLPLVEVERLMGQVEFVRWDYSLF